MDDVVAGVATVPGRTGDIPPVRPPVAMPAPGFGGSGPHCGHTPSCHRYVGVALVVVVSAGFLESAFFLAGFLESVRLGRLPGVGFSGSRPGKAAQMLGVLEGPKA